MELKFDSDLFGQRVGEKVLLNSAELADVLGMSKKWVDKHARKIAGSIKVGRARRFDVAIIKRRLALGRNLIDGCP